MMGRGEKGIGRRRGGEGMAVEGREEEGREGEDYLTHPLSQIPGYATG